MSINLATVDLTTAIVGTTFTVSLQNVGIPQDFVNSHLPITIRFFNDSCMGMDATTKKYGKQFYVPQGGWPKIVMPADETGISFVCTSQMLPVPSVCILKPVYYGPGEIVDDTGVHGNTPTNIGGSVNVTSANNLSNEGNTVGTGPIIDIGPTGFPNLWNIFNDHFVISVLIAGVAHQILKGQNAGNPLLIGQALDITEILGQLQTDDFIIANTTPSIVNGSVSGTASFYAPVWGPALKIGILKYNNYSDGSTRTFNFPSQLSVGFFGVGNYGNGTDSLSFFLVNIGQSARVITALASTGGSVAAIASIKQISIGLCPTADQLRITSTTNARTTVDFFIGA